MTGMMTVILCILGGIVIFAVSFYFLLGQKPKSEEPSSAPKISNAQQVIRGDEVEGT